MITRAFYAVAREIRDLAGKDCNLPNPKRAPFIGASKTKKIFDALATFRIELPPWGFANTGTRLGKFIQPAAERLLLCLRARRGNSDGPLQVLQSDAPHASIIIFSTLWAIALHEWKGCGGRTRLIVAFSLLVLVSSTVIVSYGNYMVGSSHRSCDSDSCPRRNNSDTAL